MNNTANKPHHSYSPSTLQFLEACPHYQSRSEANERAIAGTLAHSVIESRQDDYRLSDEDAEAVAECADFFERRKALMEGPVIELKEVYLPIDDCEFEDGTKATTAGYVDCAIISGDQTYAEMMDWKMGAWHVTKAENNLQGVSYALGLMKQYPSLDRIRFFFKMPHLDYVTDAVFTRDQIPELYRRVQVVVERAREARKRNDCNDWSLATPSTPTCNFCANIGRCEKVLAIACKIGSKFSPLHIPPDVTPTMVMDPANVKLAMQLTNVMATWSESFRRQTTDRVLRQDAPIPDGYEIQSRTKRNLVDLRLYRTIIEKYLTAEELRPLDDANPLTFTAVEKLIVDKSPRGQKKNTVQQFRTDLETVGAVKEGDSFSFLKATSKADE